MGEDKGRMGLTQQEQAEELVEAFSFFEEWEDRYGYLIDLGRELPPMPESDKTEATRIQGCQSMVWLKAQETFAAEELRFVFLADSDSAIVKGLVAILWRVFSGYRPQEVLAFNVEALLKQLSLEEHLSMNRRNGLFSMIQRIRTLATEMI